MLETIPFIEFLTAWEEIYDERYYVKSRSSIICINTEFHIDKLDNSIRYNRLLLRERLSMMPDSRVHQYIESLLRDLFSNYHDAIKELGYYEERTYLKDFLRKLTQSYYGAIILIIHIAGYDLRISFSKRFIQEEKERGVYPDFIDMMNLYNDKYAYPNQPNSVEIKVPEKKKEHYSFEIDPLLMSRFYRMCNNDVFKTDLSTFSDAISKGDFSVIYQAKDTLKTKTQYLIYVLSRHIDNEQWYTKTAGSINKTPAQCSGANVPEGWRKEINVIK